MQVHIGAPGPFEGVNYDAGIRAVDDRIAQRMIAASFAKKVKDVYATLENGILKTVVPEFGSDFNYEPIFKGESGNLVSADGKELGLTRVIAASAVPVSFTGSTAVTPIIDIPIPANIMGPNGQLRITAHWSMTNDVSSKNLLILWGLASAQIWSAGLTNVAAAACQVRVSNRGATGSQISNAGGTGLSFGTLPAPVVSSEDTTVQQRIRFAVSLSDAADTLTLESFVIELIR